MKAITSAQLQKLNNLQNYYPQIFATLIQQLKASAGSNALSGLGDLWGNIEGLVNTYLQYRVVTNTQPVQNVPVSTTQQQLAGAGISVSNIALYVGLGAAAIAGVLILTKFAHK